MTVFCKPIGRGGWTPLMLTYAGPQLAPFTVEVGARFDLGGVRWRICEVRP
jgi:hypothetical protein